MGKTGVLVISHGSRNGEWVRLVDQAVGDLALPGDVPVCSSFLEIVEGRLIQDGIDALEREGVTDLIVVPLFVSSGSTHIDEIQYALGVLPEPALETDLRPFDVRARVHFCPPMDDDPDVAQIVYDKIKPLSERPDRELVLLIGHGSGEEGFYQKWRRGLERVAARVKTLGGFDEVEGAMLLPDQVRDRMEAWRAGKPDHDVLVAPLFLSEGYFTEQVIPQRLQGFDYRYNGRAMLPHPLVSRWIERRIRERMTDLGDTLSQTGDGANGQTSETDL